MIAFTDRNISFCRVMTVISVVLGRAFHYVDELLPRLAPLLKGSTISSFRSLHNAHILRRLEKCMVFTQSQTVVTRSLDLTIVR